MYLKWWKGWTQEPQWMEGFPGQAKASRGLILAALGTHQYRLEETILSWNHSFKWPAKLHTSPIMLLIIAGRSIIACRGALKTEPPRAHFFMTLLTQLSRNSTEKKNNLQKSHPDHLVRKLQPVHSFPQIKLESKALLQHRAALPRGLQLHTPSLPHSCSSLSPPRDPSAFSLPLPAPPRVQPASLRSRPSGSWAAIIADYWVSLCQRPQLPDSLKKICPHLHLL